MTRMILFTPCAASDSASAVTAASTSEITDVAGRRDVSAEQGSDRTDPSPTCCPLVSMTVLAASAPESTSLPASTDPRSRSRRWRKGTSPSSSKPSMNRAVTSGSEVEVVVAQRRCGVIQPAQSHRVVEGADRRASEICRVVSMGSSRKLSPDPRRGALDHARAQRPRLRSCISFTCVAEAGAHPESRVARRAAAWTRRRCCAGWSASNVSVAVSVLLESAMHHAEQGQRGGGRVRPEPLGPTPLPAFCRYCVSCLMPPVGIRLRSGVPNSWHSTRERCSQAAASARVVRLLTVG